MILETNLTNMAANLPWYRFFQRIKTELQLMQTKAVVKALGEAIDVIAAEIRKERGDG